MSFDDLLLYGIIFALGYVAYKSKIEPELKRRKAEEKEKNNMNSPRVIDAQFTEANK
jgi:hypothetical protein